LTNKGADPNCILVEENLRGLDILASKYSDVLPEGYDNYIYLDSDILVDDKISSIIKDGMINVVPEQNLVGENFWHKPEFCTDEEKYIYEKRALNAGTFSFPDKSFVEGVKKALLDNITTIGGNFAPFEQSCFNYCAHIFDYDLNFLNCVKLHCHDNTKKEEGIKIYHFCGYSGSMIGKYRAMEKFINENI
jgi:hypothetical protein